MHGHIANSLHLVQSLRQALEQIEMHFTSWRLIYQSRWLVVAGKEWMVRVESAKHGQQPRHVWGVLLVDIRL